MNKKPLSREELETLLNDPNCVGIVHRIPWIRLTPEDRQIVFKLLNSWDDVESHLQLQEILDQYPCTDKELN